MKVLIIGNNIKHADIFKLICDDVYLLTTEFTKIEESRLGNIKMKYNFIWSQVKYGSPFFTAKKIKEIKKIVNGYDIDIIFSNRKDDMIATKLAFFLKNKIKLVTFHNAESWENKVKAKLMSRMSGFFADGIIALSKSCYDKIAYNNRMLKKTLYLPNTINCFDFVPKTNYEINESSLNICYVGVIDESKNQIFVLRELIKSKLKNIHLYLIGICHNQEYLIFLDKLAKKSKNVKLFMPGNVDKEILQKELHKFDIYISSSKCEMSPYNILEAKCAGLPVLASHISGHVDLIKDNIDGIIYEDDNFLEKIYKIADSKKIREKIGKTARENMETVHSVESYSKKLLKFIQQLK